MKKIFIAWLYSHLSNEEKKEITDNMLKACYPDHHLHHNPIKKEKADENNRSRISVVQEAGTKTVSLPPTKAQV